MGSNVLWVKHSVLFYENLDPVRREILAVVKIFIREIDIVVFVEVHSGCVKFAVTDQPGHELDCNIFGIIEK